MMFLAAGGDDADKASPVGLLIIILLVAVCYFLYRSMSKHLRRVREDFPDQEQPETTPEVDTSTEPETDTTATDRAPQTFVPPVRPTYAVHRDEDE